MSGFFLEVINMSLTASYVIIAVLFIRLLLKKSPKIFSYVLWTFVLFRLLCPMTIESPFSLLPKNSDTARSFVNAQMQDRKITVDTNNLTDGQTIDMINQTNVNSIGNIKSVTKNAPVTYKTETGYNIFFISLFTIIWITGMIILFMHALYNYFKLKNKLTTATIVKNNVYSTDRIMTPFVLGVIQPRIYIPSHILESEMEYILLHEQKHINRFDHWIKLVAYIALVLHWFNPLVWISYFQMVKDMEMSCDESVMKQSRKDIRANYSISLLELSVKQSGLLGPMAFGESNVKSRIKNVLNYKKPSFWIMIIAVIAVITAGICLITNPQNKEPEIASTSISPIPEAANSKTDISSKDQTSEDNNMVTNNKEEETDVASSKEEKKFEKNEIGFIDVHPGVADYSLYFGEMDKLPELSDSGYDIRSANLSKADLTNELDKLILTTFDSKTIWPDKLPEGFNPNEIMELYKNPGLLVRSLHEQGITGKGVGIAIIDQPLLVDHKEYSDQLKYYFASPPVHADPASMHGPAVASIAVGKTVGVAPGADLYYIAEDFSNAKNDNTPIAEDINKILDLNKTLPYENRIRVISISWGWDEKGIPGNDLLVEAYKRAKEEGVFVLTTSIFYREDMAYFGLGKVPLSDPDDFNSYTENKYSIDNMTYNISAPMDFRCVASPTGIEDYVVYNKGGLSWSTPYVAGLYALACQVKPEITYEEFWKLASETSRTSNGEYGGTTYEAKYIVDPVAIIDSLSE